ncbi:MAG: glycosyltransferase family 9 protein [Candidatus Binatia bacterium]
MKSEKWERVHGFRPGSLVLFPGALGDFICLLPTLELIGQASRVDLLARIEFADLVSSSVAVRSLECDAISRLFVPGAGDGQRLRSFFDSYASIYSWFGSDQLVFADELRRASQGKALLFSFRPFHDGTHQIDYYLSCLEITPGGVPFIPVKRDANAWCDDYWRRHALEKKPVLALAPGSGAREKNWPVASYRAVADWWREKVGGIVLVVFGPVEEDRGALDSICDGALVARGLTLAQLSALLSRCVLYVGNDSGTTHLAAALGVRTVALFGPSDRRRWAPRGGKVTVMTKRLDCSPCAITTMKSCPHRDCLVTLEPAGVIKRLESLPELATLTRWGVEITV